MNTNKQTDKIIILAISLCVCIDKLPIFEQFSQATNNPENYSVNDHKLTGVDVKIVY